MNIQFERPKATPMSMERILHEVTQRQLHAQTVDITESYSKLSAMVIQQWLLHEGCWQDPHPSLFKAAQIVRREANLLM